MRKIFTLLTLALSSSLLFAADGAPQTGYMSSLIMILLAVVFFYFILWRPEQKRRKAQRQQRESLKKGDKITAMGIIGTIESIEDNTIVLKTIDGSKIEMLKAAVTEVRSESEKTVDIKN